MQFRSYLFWLYMLKGLSLDTYISQHTYKNHSLLFHVQQAKSWFMGSCVMSYTIVTISLLNTYFRAFYSTKGFLAFMSVHRTLLRILYCFSFSCLDYILNTLRMPLVQKWIMTFFPFQSKKHLFMKHTFLPLGLLKLLHFICRAIGQILRCDCTHFLYHKI